MKAGLLLGALYGGFLPAVVYLRMKVDVWEYERIVQKSKKYEGLLVESVLNSEVVGKIVGVWVEPETKEIMFQINYLIKGQYKMDEVPLKKIKKGNSYWKFL